MPEAGLADRLTADLQPGDERRRVVERLSPREHEVLALVASGLANQEIAARLHLSLHTVKRHVAIFLASLVVLTGAIVLVLALADRATASRVEPTAAVDPVARGQYLVRTIGCSDCHTPKIMTDEGPVLDESRLLSGHPDRGALPPPPASVGPWIATGSWDLTAWAGPWGISYTANLTPDENTGLGIWTEDMFINAIRTGRHMGQSRPILPPMPWRFYRDLTDDDLKAIYAYLRTIPPVHNRVPTPQPPGGEGVAAF